MIPRASLSAESSDEGEACGNYSATAVLQSVGANEVRAQGLMPTEARSLDTEKIYFLPLVSHFIF